MLKTCTKCKSCKPVTDFGKHKKAKDGLSWVCKECNNTNSRKWALICDTCNKTMEENSGELE